MTPLCESADLPEGASRDFSLDTLAVLAVRRDGLLYGYRNRCPHRGVRLDGQNGRILDDTGRLIQCAHHGALFLIDTGECVVGPCLGEPLEPVTLIERDNTVWLADSTD